MSSHVVDGVALPDAVGGHPALDFCNTRAGWGAAQPKEYLVSPRALVLWCADAGLIGQDAARSSLRAAEAHPFGAATALERAVAFRASLYEVAQGRGGAASWHVVASEAESAAAAAQLLPVPRPASGAPAARWALSAPPVDLPLLAVAAAAGDLLTGALGTAVAACPGRGCGWLFADPRRRRRWCSMAVCGNRAKARRHADRTRTPTSTSRS